MTRRFTKNETLAAQARAAASKMPYTDLRDLVAKVANVSICGINKLVLIDYAVQAALDGEWVPA